MQRESPEGSTGRGLMSKLICFKRASVPNSAEHNKTESRWTQTYEVVLCFADVWIINSQLRLIDVKRSLIILLHLRQHHNTTPLQHQEASTPEGIPARPRSCLEHYHHHTTTILRPFFRDHTGELVPEENFWPLWCKVWCLRTDSTAL